MDWTSPYRGYQGRHVETRPLRSVERRSCAQGQIDLDESLTPNENQGGATEVPRGVALTKPKRWIKRPYGIDDTISV